MSSQESNSLQKERKRRKLIYKMGMKFCPKCESEDIYMETGGITGIWKCKKCGFSSSIFPEKEIIVKPKRNKK